MNYQKLDAELALAVTDAEVLDEEEPVFNVFIRMIHAPDSNAGTYLEKLGISCQPADRRIFTATLLAQAVDELSKQPWVRYLQLSQKLQLHRQNA